MNGIRVFRSFFFVVIPAKARKIFHIKPGDNIVVLGDEGQGDCFDKRGKPAGIAPYGRE